MSKSTSAPINKTENSSKISSVIYPLLVILSSVYSIFYIYSLNKEKIQKLKEENKSISTTLYNLSRKNSLVNNQYEHQSHLLDKYNLLNEQLKKLTAQIEKEEKQVDAEKPDLKKESKDFSIENDNLIKNFEERIEKIKKSIIIFKTEGIQKIIEKVRSMKKEYQMEINNKQNEINKKFKNENADLINDNKQKVKKEKEKEKVYLHYTPEQISFINFEFLNKQIGFSIINQVNSEISKLPSKLKALFSSLSNEEERINKEINLLEKEEFQSKSKFDEEINLILTRQSDIQKQIDSEYFSDSNEIHLQLKELISRIRLLKEKINTNLKDYLSDRFEYKEYYNRLYEIFNKNFNYKVLFNSNSQRLYNNVLQSFKSLIGRKNLIFFIHSDDDSIIGGFISKEFPDITLNDNILYKEIYDIDSFIFKFNSKNNKYEVYKGLSFNNKHITYKSHESYMKIAFGSLINSAGLELTIQKQSEDNENMNIDEMNENKGIEDVIFKYSTGRINFQYEKQEYGEFSNHSNMPIDKNIKSMKIFELTFIDN